MELKQSVVCGVVAGLGMASLAAGQLREIDREVSAEAMSLVSDDPVRDSDRVASTAVGLFEESASAQAVIPPLASNRSAASQQSDFEIDYRPGQDRIVAEGSAVARLFIQGLGDASAKSAYTIRFDVPEGSSFLVEDFEILVDDRFGSDVSRDRPGDASASIVLMNLDTGEAVLGFEVVLDDFGTTSLERSRHRRSYTLAAGPYEFRVRATSTDETSGFEEVQDSLAAASYRVDALVIDSSACPADYDLDGVLTLFDFLAYGSLFASGDERAELTGDGVLNIHDFLVFLSLFDQGCRP